MTLMPEQFTAPPTDRSPAHCDS